MIDDLKTNTIKSMLIKFLERILSVGTQLIISVVIARLLLPSDYGIIALINVFVVISNVFVESGFAVGLIQKKNINEADKKTVFSSSVVLSVMIYVFIYFFAPYFSHFYNNDILTKVLRIYAISILFSSIISYENSLLSRNFQYQKQLIASFISSVVSGILGIILAYHGYGVWALVFQQISGKVVYIIIIFIINKDVPKLGFEISSFKGILNFSWKIVAAKLLESVFGEIRSLIIGKMYDERQLGLYNKGQQMPSTIATATDYSLQSVMFSSYSKAQDDVVLLKRMVRRSMKVSAFFIFPIMLGLFAIAEDLILLVLTEKWSGCVPFFRISCIVYMIQPLLTANSQAINALGKSEITLKNEIVKRSLAVVLLIISCLLNNIYLIAVSAIVVSLFGWLMYCFENRRILNYSFIEQIGDVLPMLIISIGMAVCVNLFSLVNIYIVYRIIIEIILGVVVYFSASRLFKIDSLIYIIDIINEWRVRKE